MLLRMRCLPALIRIWPAGWYARTEARKAGNSAGTYDTYFFAPDGKRFRSRAEIARHFKLEVLPDTRAKRDIPKRQRATTAPLAQNQHSPTYAPLAREPEFVPHALDACEAVMGAPPNSATFSSASLV